MTHGIDIATLKRDERGAIMLPPTTTMRLSEMIALADALRGAAHTADREAERLAMLRAVNACQAERTAHALAVAWSEAEHRIKVRRRKLDKRDAFALRVETDATSDATTTTSTAREAC